MFFLLPSLSSQPALIHVNVFQRMAGIDEFKGQLGRATQDAIADLNKAAATHKEEVIKLLLDTVTNVDIKLPNEKQSKKQ